MNKKVLSLLLVFMLLLNGLTIGMADTGATNVKAAPNFNDQPVRVIVELEGDYGLNLAKAKGVTVQSLSSSDLKSLAKTQKNVKDTLEDSGIAMDVHETFTNVMNGFSMTVAEGDIDAIEKTNGVKAVYKVNEYMRPEMNSSGEYINLDQAQAYRAGKYDGRGTVVAVIDSGVDYTHKDMRLDYPEMAKLSKENVDSRIFDNEFGGRYFTEKVPYGYNYFDKNDQVKDLGEEASMHGMHVAGTIGANGNDDGINGIAPEAQLLAMKVFSNNPNYPSTYGDIIIEAIDESIAMGADVINMSLGATAGTPNSSDPEQMAVQRALEAGIACSISAGNSAFSGNGAYVDYGLDAVDLFTPDIGVTGSPSITPDSITVASLENAKVNVSTLNHTDADGNTSQFSIQVGSNLEPIDGLGTDEYEFVFCGLGGAEDFDGINVLDKIALIERGDHTFADKVENARQNGAIGVIVFNHDSGGEGLIAMGGVSSSDIPAVFMKQSEGQHLRDKGGTVSFTSDNIIIDNPVAGHMSSFSSWGTPITLDLKPEITAPGGQILSTLNDDDYGMMSGTSMAAPHIAGAAATIMQRVRDDFDLEGFEAQAMVKQLMMNTATPNWSKGQAHTDFAEFYTEDFASYNSPRQQGAGILDLYGALETPVLISDKDSGLGEVSLGEISTSKGEIEFEVEMKNYGDEAISYTIEQQVNTSASFWDILWADSMPILTKVDGGDADSFERLDLEISSANYDSASNTVTVPADGTITVSFTVDLDEEGVFTIEGKPLLDVFENGTFVEGFIRFIETEDVHADLTMPFLGFYGDWDKVQILDGNVYKDDIIPNALYGAGMFRDQNGDALGAVDPTDEDTAFMLSKVVLGSVIDFEGDYTSSYGIYPEMSLLRNVAEAKFMILDANKKVVENIGHVTEGYRKNYYDLDEDEKTTVMSDGYWNGTINGQDAANGQYYYRIQLRIDEKNSAWQNYDFPIFVDNCTPQISQLKFNVEDEKMTSVTFETITNEIITYDLSDPEKDPAIEEVPAELTKGISVYGLMDASNDFSILTSSTTSTIDLTEIYKNDSTTSGEYRLIPFVISANGSVTSGEEFVFADGKDRIGEKELVAVEFADAPITLDTSLVSGKTLSPDLVSVYETVSPSAIYVESLTEKLYWTDEYDSDVLGFKMSLNDKEDKVQLEIEEKYTVKEDGKTFISGIYPLNAELKKKLDAESAVSDKFIKEVESFIEDEGYYVNSIKYDNNLISEITASTEPAAAPVTSGSAVTVSSGSAITIDIISSPMVTEPDILDGYEEGVDYFRAKSLVIAANKEFTEPTGAVDGDKQPPTIIIDAPVFGGEYSDKSNEVHKFVEDGKTIYTIDFTGYVEDDSALEALLLDKEEVEVEFNNRTGSWEFNLELEVEDGHNEFFMFGADAAGNQIEYRQEFFVDLYEPVLSIDTSKIKYYNYGNTYALKLNGYVSDTFPELKLKAGKELIVNERSNFDEYLDKLQPVKVSLNGIKIPLEKGQETLYLELRDFGGHLVTAEIQIPESVYTVKKPDKDDDDDKKSSGSKKSSGGSSKSSGGGSPSAGGSNDSASQAKDKDVTSVGADKFQKSNMTEDNRVVIKAPAPAEKNEVKLNLGKDALKAAKANKAVLEIDAGIAKLNLDAENFSDSDTDSVDLNIASVKGPQSVQVQAKAASQLVEKLKPVGDIIDINLNFNKADQETKVHMLKKPVDIEIPVTVDTSVVDVDKLGLFYNNEETGEWEYVGGRFDASTGTFKATLDHFSQYCIMEREINFTDTDAHWAESVIEKVAAQDIVSGYSDGSFQPDGTVTYAQFLTLVVKALDFETTYEGENWYDAYIFTSRMKGLIDPKFTFDPNANITREEMAQILGKYLETAEAKESKYDPITFIDSADIDAESLSAVNTAVQNGLFSGRADGSFDPKATATRAEVAQVMYDLIQLVQ